MDGPLLKYHLCPLLTYLKKIEATFQFFPREVNPRTLFYHKIVLILKTRLFRRQLRSKGGTSMYSIYMQAVQTKQTVIITAAATAFQVETHPRSENGWGEG